MIVYVAQSLPSQIFILHSGRMYVILVRWILIPDINPTANKNLILSIHPNSDMQTGFHHSNSCKGD